ncbi:MAG TPA: hypothetical protein VHW00_18060 [Thermoanaerobaculia bacterium]|nr:hypothetical protein [Thermoanaerobaculia bacterium]
MLLFTIASPLSALVREPSLRVDPSTILPGLSAGMVVTLPQRVASLEIDRIPAVLHVVNDRTGDEFDAIYEEAPNAIGEIWITSRVSRADRAIDVRVPLLPPMGEGWFEDPRLLVPGTYRLRLHVLASRVGGTRDIVSDEATLRVREPVGEEEEAWIWLRAQAKGEWHRRMWFEEGRSLANELIQRFPKTEYARHAAGYFIHDRETGEASLERAIELSHGTWIEDYYRAIQLGNRANAVGRECANKTLDECRGALARIKTDVRRQLTEIAERTKSPSARHVALATREQLGENE